MTAEFLKKLIALTLVGTSITFAGCLEEDKRSGGGGSDDCKDDSDCDDDEVCNEDEECEKVDVATGSGSGNPGATSGGTMSGGTTTGGTTSGTTSGATSSAATTSSGDPPGCDNSGDCGTCSQCAQSGVCAPELNACGSNSACIQIIDCINVCPPDDTVCMQGCVDEMPAGQTDFFALLDCINFECSNDCAQ